MLRLKLCEKGSSRKVGTYLIRARVNLGEFIGLFFLALDYRFNDTGMIGPKIDEAVAHTKL